MTQRRSRGTAEPLCSLAKSTGSLRCLPRTAAMSLLHDAGLYLSSHEQSKLTSASGRSPYHPEKARSFFRVQELRQRLHGLLDARCAAHGPLLDASSSKPAFFRAAFGFTELGDAAAREGGVRAARAAADGRGPARRAAYRAGNEGGKVDVEVLLSDVLGEILVRPEPEEPAEPAVEDQAPRSTSSRRRSARAAAAEARDDRDGDGFDRRVDGGRPRRPPPRRRRAHEGSRRRGGGAAAAARGAGRRRRGGRLDGADEPYTPRRRTRPARCRRPASASTRRSRGTRARRLPRRTRRSPSPRSCRAAARRRRRGRRLRRRRGATRPRSARAWPPMRCAGGGRAPPPRRCSSTVTSSTPPPPPTPARRGRRRQRARRPRPRRRARRRVVARHPSVAPRHRRADDRRRRRRRARRSPPYATAPADEVENVPPKTAASPSDVLRLAAAAGSRIRLDDEHPSMMPWASSWMDQSKRPSSRRVRALPRGSQIPWG